MSFDNKFFSRFELKKIAMVYSRLSRPGPFYEHAGDLSLDIEIGFLEQKEEKQLLVFIELKSQDQGEEGERLEIEIRAEGVFQVLDHKEPEIDLDYFIHVNAPAIIYPYIRQHVTYLSLQAGTQTPIILPIVNFIQLHEQREENSLSE